MTDRCADFTLDWDRIRAGEIPVAFIFVEMVGNRRFTARMAICEAGPGYAKYMSKPTDYGCVELVDGVATFRSYNPRSPLTYRLGDSPEFTHTIGKDTWKYQFIPMWS